MSKHKLFVPNDYSLMLNSSETEEMTPNKGGRYSHLVDSPEQDTKCDSRNPEDAKESKPDFDIVEDSDSDSIEIVGFFSNSNQKLPYTRQEDELIVKYVLKDENIFKVSSILLWKRLEAKKENPRRTYQSLKNRFLRNIKPCMFTTYRHLIKDKQTTEKILSKFPELKKHVGRTEVISRLNLPERKYQTKDGEDGVSNTNANEFQLKDEIMPSLRKPNSENEPNPAAHSECEKLIQVESKSLGSDFFKPGIYQKEVKANNGCLSVCVNLNSEKFVETSFSSTSLGIYEKFQKLKAKNKLFLCPTCGRYNRPKRVSSVKSSEETDLFVPNSVVTPKSASKNLKRIRLTPKSKTTQPSRRRIINSTPKSSVHTPPSPNLLTDISEAAKIDERVLDEVQEGDERAETSQMHYCQILRENAEETACSEQAGQSNSLSSSNGTNNTRRSNRVARAATRTAKGASNSKSNKKVNSVRAKRRRGNDTDYDSICEDAMANFRKLIDYEEEKQLVRKCLHQNFKSIGLEAVSQMNLDSYFLESPSDIETTPPLTIDFDAYPGSNEKEERSGGGTGSSLSQNLGDNLHEASEKS